MSAEIVDMTVLPTSIEGLWRLNAKAVTDERGTVRELFRATGFKVAGLVVPERWHQINMTWTHHGGIRGLHGEAMTKLVGVAYGEAFGVYLDARTESASHGAIVTIRLTQDVQVLVPPGVCNGFQSVSTPGCQYIYCFDAEWSPTMNGVAVNPLDPDLGIEWPVPPDPFDPSSVSAKDVSAPSFAEL